METTELTRRAALLLGLTSALFVAQLTTSRTTANPGSRLATMDALVHDGTFAIDRSVFRDTIDKVFVGGHYYSSKPPVLSTVGAGVYGALHHLTGLSFRGPTRPQAVWAVTVVLMLGAHLLLLVYGYRLLALWLPSPALVLAGFATLAFAYLGFGYATSINNHTPAAAVSLAAFYYAYLVRSGGSRAPRHWALAGALAALAPTLDLAAMFVSTAIGVYLLGRDWRAVVRWFAPAALVPLALHFLLTYLVSGSVLPIYLRHELYLYPGSYWNAPVGIDALDEPKHVYLWHMLVGHHGLLAMTPLFVLALVALGRGLRRGAPRRPEAMVVSASLVALVTFYAVTTKNYGGVCVGFRWLIVIMPFLVLFVGEWLREAHGRVALVVFVVLYGVSQVNAVDALGDPWRRSAWHTQLVRWGR